MAHFEKVVNIGPVTAQMLQQVGINSIDELRAVGAENAFIRLRTIDSGACLSLLQGLEGAIVGTRWHELPLQRRNELKDFYKSCH